MGWNGGAAGLLPSLRSINGAPAKPSFRLCGERRHSGAVELSLQGKRTSAACADDVHDGSAAGWRCASPVRDGRLRCGSGKIRLRFAGAGLLPSLRSIRPAHDGSAAGYCHSFDTEISW